MQEAQNVEILLQNAGTGPTAIAELRSQMTPGELTYAISQGYISQ